MGQAGDRMTLLLVSDYLLCRILNGLVGGKEVAEGAEVDLEKRHGGTSSFDCMKSDQFSIFSLGSSFGRQLGLYMNTLNKETSNFSVNGQIINILGLVGHTISATAT